MGIDSRTGKLNGKTRENVQPSFVVLMDISLPCGWFEIPLDKNVRKIRASRSSHKELNLGQGLHTDN